MAKKSPIFYSALLLTGVNLLLRLVSTGFQVYLSGRLGAAGVGLLQLVLSVGSMAMVAGIAGVRTAAMYLTAEELGRKKPENVCHILSGCIGYSLLWGGAVAVCLYFFAPALARGWIGDSRTVPALRLLAASLPVSCLCGVMTGYFTAAGRIRILAAVEVLEQLFSIAVTFLLLHCFVGQSAPGACLCVVAGSGAGACLTLLCLSVLRILERAPRGAPIPLARRLTGIALPLALADDFKAGINTAENLIVPKRLALYPGAADPLGLFGTVSAMVFPVLMFPASIVFSLAELLIPEMSRCAAAASQTRIRYLARQSLRVVLIYGLFCGGILHLLSGPLCQLLYKSHTAGRYLSMYSLLAPMLYCDSIVDAMNKGLGQQRIAVCFNILTAILDVLFLFVLLPVWGMDGYFLSFFLTHLLNFILSLCLLLRTARLSLCPKLPLLAALCTVAAVMLCRRIPQPLFCVCAYTLAFPAALTLTGVVSKQDLFWLKGLLGK